MAFSHSYPRKHKNITWCRNTVFLHRTLTIILTCLLTIISINLAHNAVTLENLRNIKYYQMYMSQGNNIDGAIFIQFLCQDFKVAFMVTTAPRCLVASPWAKNPPPHLVWSLSQVGGMVAEEADGPLLLNVGLASLPLPWVPQGTMDLPISLHTLRRLPGYLLALLTCKMARLKLTHHLLFCS